MTIAAGILCSDGIIVCADTEHTGYISKYQASKIILLDDNSLLTGAGSTDYIHMTADKLRDRFRNARPADPSDARQTIENVVQEVHEQHIFKFWTPSDPSRPAMQLIIAVRCEDGSQVLIRTTDAAALIGSDFEIVGFGQPIFDYWCRYLYRDKINMSGMVYLAMFMLREVKKVHPTCGGSSHICYLPKAADAPKITRFIDEQAVLGGFPNNVTRILSACFFPDRPDSWIETQLLEFSCTVRNLRAPQSPEVPNPSATGQPPA